MSLRILFHTVLIVALPVSLSSLLGVELPTTSMICFNVLHKRAVFICQSCWPYQDYQIKKNLSTTALNSLSEVLTHDGKFSLITLRLSENKFTGKGTTDTGNRLCNTTELA